MASNFIYESPFLAPPSTVQDCKADSIPLLERDTDLPPPSFGKGHSCRPSPPRPQLTSEPRLDRSAANESKSSSNEQDFASDLDRQLSMNISIKFREDQSGLNDRHYEEDSLRNILSRGKPHRPKYTCCPTTPYDPRGTLIDSYRNQETPRTPDVSLRSTSPGTPRRETEPILTTFQRNCASPSSKKQQAVTNGRPKTPSHSLTPSLSSNSSATWSYSSISSPPRSKTPSPSPSSAFTMSSSSSTLAPTISVSSSRRISPDLLPRRKISYAISPPTPSELYPFIYDNPDYNEALTPFLDPRGPPPTPPLEPYRQREDDAFSPILLTQRSFSQAAPPAKTLRKQNRPAIQPAPPPSPVGTPAISADTEVSFMDLDSSDDEEARGLKKIKSLARMRAGSRTAVPTQSSLSNTSTAPTSITHHQRTEPRSRQQSIVETNATIAATRSRQTSTSSTASSNRSRTSEKRKGFPKVWRIFCCGSGDATT